MVAKNDPEPDAVFSPAQEARLAQLMKEAVASSKPPEAPANEPKVPRVSDAEWDGMSERAREGWVRSVVDFHLKSLAKEDEDAKLRAKVAELETRKIPEKPPSVAQRLQRLLWGTEPEPR